jgi:hypothetical protein
VVVGERGEGPLATTAWKAEEMFLCEEKGMGAAILVTGMQFFPPNYFRPISNHRIFFPTTTKKNVFP